MRIVFMGTPSFAKTSLQALLDGGFDVVGVFTKPDKPKNRGMKMAISEVKELALEHEIPIFQPEKMRDGTALEALKSLKPDLVCVVAYGRILPEDMLAVPKFGTINIHGSLLPKYRGAAPIQWAVLNGDEITGVSSMYLAPEMDTGDVIYTSETKIGEYESSGELFERLSLMGGELLCKTVTDIFEGKAPRTPQDHNKATLAPPLSKEMSEIDWSKPSREIVKQVYGLKPWPMALTTLCDTTFKIHDIEYTENATTKNAGEVVSANPKVGLEIACGGGKTLLITKLQAAGGKPMSAKDYLRGHSEMFK